MAIKPVTNENALNKSEINRAEQTSFRSEHSHNYMQLLAKTELQHFTDNTRQLD